MLWASNGYKEVPKNSFLESMALRCDSRAYTSSHRLEVDQRLSLVFMAQSLQSQTFRSKPPYSENGYDNVNELVSFYLLKLKMSWV